MKRMEDGYKIKCLTDYKMLLSDAFVQEEWGGEIFFELHNLLETEIENVVDRLIFENTYEIFPN